MTVSIKQLIQSPDPKDFDMDNSKDVMRLTLQQTIFTFQLAFVSATIQSLLSKKSIDDPTFERDLEKLVKIYIAATTGETASPEQPKAD